MKKWSKKRRKEILKREKRSRDRESNNGIKGVRRKKGTSKRGRKEGTEETREEERDREK